MAALRNAILALALLWAAPGAASPIDRWSAHIEEASARFGIPADWIRRVMRAESGGRTTRGGRPIVSHAGAMGLMQIMPATWAELRAVLGLRRDPHQPRENILAGTYYLRLMHDRFGYPGLFGAYNAGPERYARHLSMGRRLPRETVAYVAQISGSRPSAIVSDSAAPAPPALFAIRSSSDTTPIAAPVPRADPSRNLFVRLSTAAPR